MIPRNGLIRVALIYLLSVSVAGAAETLQDLSEIAWLAGHWKGVGDDGVMTGRADSIWTAPAEGVMSLTFRWHRPEENHVHFAFSVIEKTHRGTYLRGIHHGRDFRTFEDNHWTMQLADFEANRARFVCVSHCRADSVEFELKLNGGLVESWRKEKDEDPVFVIEYVKQHQKHKAFLDFLVSS